MNSATHHAYSSAANPRSKPIIFWGVWLYFGPSALFVIWILWDSLKAVNEGTLLLRLDLDTIIGLSLPLAYGILSIWALWSVTKGYLRKEPQNKDASKRL